MVIYTRGCQNQGDQSLPGYDDWDQEKELCVYFGGKSDDFWFKQLGPGVETRVHGVQDGKRVWFEVELQGAQRDREVEVFHVSNDDAALAQRRLEDKQLEEKTNTDCLVKEQKKVHLGKKVGANIMVTGVPGGPRFEVPARAKDAEYRLCLSVTPKVEIVGY
ncbi:hypothetical protein Tco_0739886 [Tanacetum coccineum]